MGICLDKLSEAERREIAAGCFKVDDKAGSEKKGELVGLCPLHNEKTPSFSYNYMKDVYFCFGCRASGDLVKLWCKVNGKDETEGFKAFCGQYGIALEGGDTLSAAAARNDRRRRKMQESAPALDAVFDSLGTLPESWILRLERERGWSRDMIGRIGIRLQTKYQAKKTGEIKPIKNPERIAIPIRDVGGSVRNIRLYRPFKDKQTPSPQPSPMKGEGVKPAGEKGFSPHQVDRGENEQHPFDEMVPAKKETPKIISWGEAYGAARLFPAAPGLFFRNTEGGPLPGGRGSDGVGHGDGASIGSAADSIGSKADCCGDWVEGGEDPILLCEGESDCICALSHGFNAITQTSKPKNWLREQAEVFSGRDVVIAYDADQPGQKYAAEFAAPVLAKVARSVKILEWPDFMGRGADGEWPADHGQDLTDFFVRHRKTAEDLWDLVDAALPVDLLPFMSSQAMAFFERGLNDRLSFKPRLLAEKILKDMKLLSDPDTGLMYQWNGRFWESYNEDHVRNYALHLLGIESQKSRAEDATFQCKMLSTIPHHRKVNDMIDWVCVKNGMVNLKTLELAEHDPEFYCTYEIPVRYNPDSDRSCARFLRYLDETIATPDVIKQVQEFFGYCFTRETRYEKCLLLLGPGADGKSRLMQLLRELIGPENCAAVSFEGLEDQFQRSSIYNKSLNISTEIGFKALDSQYFKAIISGDPISAAFKHKNMFEFTPYSKLIFAGNKLPKMLDNSDGYFRRIMPIQFKRQFLEGDPDRDPHLQEKLTAELSEIFSWSLVGLHRLRSQGKFTDCEETQEIMFGYRRLNNPVVCFVVDECEINDECQASKKDLYKKYREYCAANGYQPFSKENFFRELYAAQSNLKISRIRPGVV